MPSSEQRKNKQIPDGLSLRQFYGRARPVELRIIEELRVQVWKASGFPIKAECQNDTHWGDTWDSVSTHFLIYHENKIIAATRVSIHGSVAETPYPEWFPNIQSKPPFLYISRLVVHPDFQKRGLGDFLDNQCINLGKQQGAGAILCDTPEYRVAPLLKRGWTLTCEPKLGVLFPTMRFSGMMLNLDE